LSLHKAFVAVWMGAPFWHTLTVHVNPSSGTIVLSTVCEQPVIALQASTVHGLPSLQSTADPPEHILAWHVCPDRHNVVEQAEPFGNVVLTHMPFTTESAVHGF
jgi:hypothetical protein